MSDKFEKVAKQAAESLVPGFKSSMGFLSAIFGSNDEKFQQAVQKEYEDLILELQKRVEQIESELQQQGKDLDALKDSQKASIFKAFVEEIFRTNSNEKREALLNITARQFDPTLGTLATRQYWRDEIAKLQDVEIQGIQLMGDGLLFITEMGQVYTINHPDFPKNQFSLENWKRHEEIDPLGGDALRFVLWDMVISQDGIHANYKSILQGKHQFATTNGERQQGFIFMLSNRGKRLWEVIKNPTIQNEPNT